MGSFANVCIHRIPKDLSIVKPRSSCPNCGKFIYWYDNIPVLSFIILSGKCRNCKTGISIQYPLVELMTGILFIFIGMHFWYDPVMTLVYFVFTLLLVITALIDIYHQIIPDMLSFMILGLALAFSFFNPEMGINWKIRFVNSLMGGFFSAFALFLIGYIGTLIFKKEAMGGGDIKLILGIGALLGLKKAFIVLFLASLIGSIAGIALIITGKNKRGEYIPFGPFINIAAYICIFIPQTWFIW
jgi:leader peptidase (prepilin peptidase)/N-methyltransferase